jgi:hypothetical protein
MIGRRGHPGNSFPALSAQRFSSLICLTEG